MSANITTSPRQSSGVVVSDKMHKTCVVRVERRVKHPLYGKFMRRSSKMHVHDQNNLAKIGDSVTIRETRPISKMKTWVLVSIDKHDKRLVATTAPASNEDVSDANVSAVDDNSNNENPSE